MGIQRSTIKRGPAVVRFDGATFWTKSDIRLTVEIDSFPVESSAYGPVDFRTRERKAQVSFTPVGEWESLSVLFPYGSMNIGTSIFTASDKPLEIHTLDGQKLTLKAAAVTKPPDIVMSATKTRFGEVQFTGIGQDNTEWTTADSLLASASVAFSDTSFDPANIKTEPVTAAWGASPWNSFQTADGFTVSHDVGFQDISTDSDGLVDMMLSTIGIRARARPLGITEAQLITAMKVQGASNARGKSLSGSDLVITASTGVVTVKGAALVNNAMEFGSASLRIGELEWMATRTLVNGVVQPLITIA